VDSKSWLISGSAAVVWAMESAWRMVCWSSCELSGARNRAVASTVTPVVIAT
jgi:hypothetical protein